MVYYKKEISNWVDPLTLNNYYQYKSTDDMPPDYGFSGWTTINKTDYDTGVAYNAANSDIATFFRDHPTFNVTPDGTLATNVLNTVYILNHQLAFPNMNDSMRNTDRFEESSLIQGWYEDYISVVPPVKAYYSSTLSKYIVDHPYIAEYKAAATAESTAMRYVDMTDAEIQSSILEMVLLYNTADSIGLTLDISSSDISGLKAESVATKSDLDILL